jgi:hypothetical protein
MGSLQDALPEPVSPETEQALIKIIDRKTAAGVGMYVEAIRIIEAAYGPEARERIRENRAKQVLERVKAWAESIEDNDLRTFCYTMEQGCRGSHEWEKLEDTEVRQAYRFTRCAWADIFRELGAADIGFWICANDGPAAQAFNPAIHFERTKTLMEGDDCCDHVYWVGE